MEIAASFYGLTVLHISSPEDNDSTLAKLIDRQGVLGVIIAADALNSLSPKALERSIKGRTGGRLPLLILGVSPDTDASLLRTWSSGAAVECRRMNRSAPIAYSFGFVDGFTRQLGGLSLPGSAGDFFYFLPGEKGGAQEIIDVRQANNRFPVYIENSLDELKMFLACASPLAKVSAGATADNNIVDAFTQIAPALMFIRYCAGEKGWHSGRHYANLTIDDPWLREPYGHLSYISLLSEMQKHNFHSTIAFIPWNYDRSEARVMSLLCTYPDRFSICIHGDNHDHKEFTDYRDKPLNDQILGMRQSLARMNRFQVLTGIPYDRVMVFPHSIAPENTLASLKSYNYLATINSSNVPMDRSTPPPLPFSLRPVTLSFASFPSIRRYSVEAPIPTGFVAINQFLENPLFFYCHQTFFSSGIDAFDRLADEVNNTDPNTSWRGVGEIIRHLYLLKQRDNVGYDVLALSSNFDLDNLSARGSIFYIKKEESGRPAIQSLKVDGVQLPYRLQDGYMGFSVSIPPGATRHVVIKYGNDFQLASTDISKRSSRVYFLRMASDFRDIVLSKSSVGRAVIRFYSVHELRPTQVVACLSIFVLCCMVGIWYVRSLSRRPLQESAISKSI